MPGTTDTYYTDDSDVANLVVQLFGSAPGGTVNYVDTGSCGHDENCIINRFAAQLSQSATNCTVGAGGAFGMPQQSYGYTYSGFRQHAYSTTSTSLYDTGFSSANCLQAQALESLEASFPQNTYTYAYPQPNSNSFTYSLLKAAAISVPASLTQYLTAPVSIAGFMGPRAPGWGYTLTWH